MLTSMRNGLNSFFVIFLLGILIASFAIWGIGDIFTARSLSVATVGEKEITVTDYMNEFQSRLRNLQAQYGPEFDTDRAVSLGLHRIVLSEIVSRTSLDEEARNLGLIGSPDAIRAVIRDMDVFKDPSGKFNLYSYEQALASAGISPQFFEQSMLIEHARTQLVNGVAISNTVPEALLDTIYTFRKEKRRAKILNISSSDVGAIDEPDEAALRTYHEQYSNYFMRPQYRDLEFIVLNPGDFADEIEFSEETLLAAYDERSGQYSTPETRDLQVFVLDDEAAAMSVYDRIQNGETLIEIARDMMDFSIEDITLGEVDYYNLEIDYNEVAATRVFELTEGGVTLPVQTMFGWHVFHVTNINQAVTVEYQTVRDDIIKELSDIAGYDAVYELVDNIEDSLAAGSDIDTLQEETGLGSIHLEAIDRGGLNQNGQLSDLAESVLPFIATGFSGLPGDELILESFGEAGFYLVQINEIIEAELKPFEEVESEVKNRWYDNERIRRAGELANQSLIAAQAGTSLEELAENFSASVIETDILQRDQSRGNLEISRPVFELIFSLEENGVDMERSATGDGYLLVQVTMKSPGIPDQTDPSYEELKQTLNAEISQGLLLQYQKSVADNMEIEVNDQLLEDLFSNDGIYQNIPGQF